MRSNMLKRVFSVPGGEYVVLDNHYHFKDISGPGYKSLYNKKAGMFYRWGDSISDDPIMAPLPEIMDIEIATTCSGVDGKGCPFCYKSNSSNRGRILTSETFSSILNMVPPTVGQIAFGVGDFFGMAADHALDIFGDARARGIVPNVTINGYKLTWGRAELLAHRCGAVAVSRYDPPDVCYNAVEMLTNVQDGQYSLQVNIHQVLSRATLASCHQLIDDVKENPRLANLNAVVFLMAKPKGRASKQVAERGLVPPTEREYMLLLGRAMESGINFGFDSCSGPSFLHATQRLKVFKDLAQMIDPCESGLFSIYVNVDGEVFPCSFMEGEPGWETGLQVRDFQDFTEIWYHPRMIKWRESLLTSTRGCDNCEVKYLCRKCLRYAINVCGATP